MCVCSICCMNTSDRMLDEGAPMARLSVWMCVRSLNVKKFCLVMVSYHVSSSWVIVLSTILFANDWFRMFLVSVSGMLEYMLSMSSEANVCDGWNFTLVYSCVDGNTYQ